jgi:hypothetical protein
MTKFTSSRNGNQYFTAESTSTIIGNFLALLLISINCFAGEDRSLENQRLRLSGQIVSKLVEIGICRDKNDCSQQQMFFIGPSKKGLSITVFGVVDRSALADLSHLIILGAASIPESMEISADFFSDSKQDSLQLPFWKTSTKVLTITVKGG